MLNQRTTSPVQFAALVSDLLTNTAARAQMQSALAQWHQPTAAADIAERILRACGLPVTGSDSAEAEWQPPARFAKLVENRKRGAVATDGHTFQSAIP